MSMSPTKKSLIYSLSILIVSVIAIFTLGLLPGIGAAIGVAQASKGDIS